MSGDTAVAMRAAFHQLAPTQWQVFAQQMSYALVECPSDFISKL
jgi:hypothetical protein